MHSCYDTACTLFAGTSLRITIEGRPYLGAPLGSPEFKSVFLQERVCQWRNDVIQLFNFASSQPHAAYSAMIHGLSSRWTFLTRTVCDLSSQLAPLEEAIRLHLLPKLCLHAPNDSERAMFALPIRQGGLGVFDPCKSSQDNYQFSTSVTSPLASAILNQLSCFDSSILQQQRALKQEALSIKRQNLSQRFSEFFSTLSNNLQLSLKLAGEKGASSWLSTLPLECHGFALHKGGFCDALALRYGWSPKNLPVSCVCGRSNNIEHALSCPNGAFPTIRHNDIRDLTAELMSEVCHDVSTVPPLQHLSGESPSLRTANQDDGARLDIKASGFWGSRFEPTFFDVRIFNPYAPSNRCNPYHQHETSKRRQYEERVREVEHGNFSPLVFSTSGPLWLTSAWPSSYLVSGNHPTVG